VASAIPESTRVVCFRWTFVVLAALTLGLAVGSRAVHAQKGGGVSSTEIRGILSEGTLSASQKSAVTKYFEGSFFPQFVKPGRGSSLDDLPRVRKDLRTLCRVAKGAAREHLNQITLDAMKKNLKGKFDQNDAAIKYNSVLAINDLNVDDTKPLPAALPVLLDILKSPSQKDYLKTAALIGLERFAAADAIPKDKAADVTQVLLAIVSEPQPPAGRDATVHTYLRRSAAQVLAAMGSPGPGNNVLNAFEAIVADPAARPSLRCEIAQLIGKLKYPPTAKVDFNRLANLIGHQTVEICKHEVELADAEKRPASRRDIMFALFSSFEGLKGLNKATTDAVAKGLIKSIGSKVDSLNKALEDTDETPDDQVASKVTTSIGEIQQLLSEKTAATAATGALVASERQPKPTKPTKPK